MPFESTRARFFLYTTVIAFGLCAASVTVVTGWSGQLSLAQMAYAGLGGLMAYKLHIGFSLDIGWGNTRLLDFQLVGLVPPIAIVVAALITAAIAALTGIGALRVRMHGALPGGALKPVADATQAPRSSVVHIQAAAAAAPGR